MSKIKNWWNTPITRGDYVKACVGSVAIFGLEVLGFMAYVGYDTMKRNSIKAQIERLDKEETVEDEE